MDKAILLGVVEGLTEYLPVSSTGHLILFGDLLSYTDEKAKTFSIFIQTGAILAVVILYWRRFWLLLDFSNNSGFTGKKGILKLFVASLPAFILGALFHSSIKMYLFNSFSVALAFIVGALIMLLVEGKFSTSQTNESLESLSFRKCFLIGLAQCAALWPGMSRSASTIIGGMLTGLDRKSAAEFSFLVAVPVLSAAALYDLLKSWSHLTAQDLPDFIVGFLVSFLVAALAIKTFIAFLSKFTLRPFAYYRILVGVGLIFWT